MFLLGHVEFKHCKQGNVGRLSNKKKLARLFYGISHQTQKGNTYIIISVFLIATAPRFHRIRNSSKKQPISNFREKFEQKFLKLRRVKKFFI